MNNNIKGTIKSEFRLFFYVTFLALLLVLFSVWPALYNQCWEIWYAILLPVYGVYLSTAIIRLVLWRFRTAKGNNRGA